MLTLFYCATLFRNACSTCRASKTALRKENDFVSLLYIYHFQFSKRPVDNLWLLPLEQPTNLRRKADKLLFMLYTSNVETMSSRMQIQLMYKRLRCALLLDSCPETYFHGLKVSLALSFLFYSSQSCWWVWGASPNCMISQRQFIICRVHRNLFSATDSKSTMYKALETDRLNIPAFSFASIKGSLRMTTMYCCDLSDVLTS